MLTWLLKLVGFEVVLHVHAWVVRGDEDCGEVSGKLDRHLKGVPQGVSPHLLHTWTLVLIGSSYCWNNQGRDCKGAEKPQQFNTWFNLSWCCCIKTPLSWLYLTDHREIAFTDDRGEHCLTWGRPQKGDHKNWHHWDCSESWQRPRESWGMYGSQSVGQRWHQTVERWTGLSSCSASAWSEVWKTSSLGNTRRQQEQRVRVRIYQGN